MMRCQEDKCLESDEDNATLSSTLDRDFLNVGRPLSLKVSSATFAVVLCLLLQVTLLRNTVTKGIQELRRMNSCKITPRS